MVVCTRSRVRQKRRKAVAESLKVAGEWRNKEAAKHQEAPQMFPTDASKIPEGADSFFIDAAAYYGTSRGKHERSDQRVLPMSYDLMVSYDSFNLQHLISPRPLLMIAGSNAQTLHYSRTAVSDAGEPGELFIIDGKNHFDLYDNVIEAASKIIEFFGKSLQ